MLKSHDFPTATLAWAVQRHVDGIEVFGGICCDDEIGGVNPAAVEVALRLGAKIVWLPTLSSRQDVVNGVAAQLGRSGPGLVVTDDDGALLPATREVLALVLQHGAVLATGHVSAAEHYAVVREHARRGPVLLTHATEDLAGPKLTSAQCVQLAEMGAWVELCAMTCIGALATKTVGDMVATIHAVGPGRVTRHRLRAGDQPASRRRLADVRRRALRGRTQRDRDPHDGVHEPLRASRARRAIGWTTSATPVTKREPY